MPFQCSLAREHKLFGGTSILVQSKRRTLFLILLAAPSANIASSPHRISQLVISSMQRFEHAQRNQHTLHALRAGDPQYVEALQSEPLEFLQHIPAESILAAPEQVFFMLQNIVTIYNEMKLSKHDRAGPQLSDEDSLRPGKRPWSEPAHAIDPETQQLNHDEFALSILMQKHGQDEYISIRQANSSIPSCLGSRSNHKGFGSEVWRPNKNANKTSHQSQSKC